MSGAVSSGADVACCAPAGAWAAGASLTGLTDVRMLRTLRKVACCFGLPFQETLATSCRNIGSSCFSANLTGFDGSEKVKSPEIYLDLVMTSLEPAQFAGSMTLHRSLKVPLTMVVTVALVTRVFVSCRMIEHTG